MYMLRRKTSLSENRGFTLLEMLAVIAIISILTAVSVPAYQNIKRKTEEKVLEYNARMISFVLREYLEEQRLEETSSRQTIRRLTATPVGDPENPLFDKIDGTNLEETWIIYVNASYGSEGYGGFELEWKNYRVKCYTGKEPEIETITDK